MTHAVPADQNPGYLLFIGDYHSKPCKAQGSLWTNQNNGMGFESCSSGLPFIRFPPYIYIYKESTWSLQTAAFHAAHGHGFQRNMLILWGNGRVHSFAALTQRFCRGPHGFVGHHQCDQWQVGVHCLNFSDVGMTVTKQLFLPHVFVTVCDTWDWVTRLPDDTHDDLVVVVVVVSWHTCR